MKKPEIIKNPLTLIAIFAGISDLAMTAVLPLLPSETQGIFMWFVMGYPLLLVCGFFYILIWKREALYAPSDFKDDATWLDVYRDAERKILNKYPLERAIVAQDEEKAIDSQVKEYEEQPGSNYFYKFLRSIGFTHNDIEIITSKVDNIENLPSVASELSPKKEIPEMIIRVLDEFPNSRIDFLKLKSILKGVQR